MHTPRRLRERGIEQHQTRLVPTGLETAAAWTWRLLVLALGIYVLAIVTARLKIVVLPIAIAILLTALTWPLVKALKKIGAGQLLATWTTLLLVIGALGTFFTITGAQLAAQFTEVGRQVNEGINTVTNWLTDGPLNLSQEQIDASIEELRDRVGENQGAIAAGALTGAVVAVEVLVGIILTLFVTFFLLYDGERIWRWIVTRFPREKWEQTQQAGEAAWRTLSGYIRGTSIVAAADAAGVALALLIMGVPLVIPLAVLTFLGAYIPLVGAVLAGSAAVLVALVTQGPVAALVVLGAVIAVQQLEGHVLQPIVLGKAVSLHPLVIALSLAAGAVVAGLPGAIVAVPLVAVLNTVAKQLANPDSPEETRDAGKLVGAEEGSTSLPDKPGSAYAKEGGGAETSAGDEAGTEATENAEK